MGVRIDFGGSLLLTGDPDEATAAVRTIAGLFVSLETYGKIVGHNVSVVVDDPEEEK